ncbi:AsmA family protein [Parachitinimonas caeni]
MRKAYRFFAHKRFKTALMIAGISLLMLAVAPPLINLSFLAPAAEQAVANATGRRLQVRGSIHAALLPRPGLTLGEITLYEADGRTPFAVLDSARLGLAWLPLLFGRSEVTDLRLDGLKANVVRSEEGRLNIDDLFRRPAEPSRLKWQLARIDLNRALLEYRDGTDLTRLDEVEIHLADPESDEGTATIAATLRQPDWQGKVDANGALRFNRELGVTTLDRFNLRLTGDAANWKGAELNASAKLNVTAMPWRVSASQFKAQASVKRGEQTWRMKVDTPALQVGESGISTGALTSWFSVKGVSRQLEGELTVAKLQGERYSLSLAADAAALKLKLDDPVQSLWLDFQSPLRIDDGRRFALSAFSLTGAYRHRALPRGAINVQLGGNVGLDIAHERLDWRSHGSIDKAPITASFSLSDFVSPRYEFGVDLAKLDLTPYLPVAAAEAKVADPSHPLDWSWLAPLNAKGELKVGEVNIGKVRLFNLATRIDAHDKRAALDPFSVDIYGGRMRGTLALDTRNAPSLSLQQKLTGMEVGALLTDTLTLDRFEGLGDADLDLSCHGNSVAEWRRSLEGKVKVKLTRGAIGGIDIADALRSLRLNLARLTGADFKADKARKTRFSDLQANFLLKDGIAENQDLRIRTSILKLAGDGRFDLGRNAVDYTVYASVSGNTGVPELDALRGVEIPIHIGGALDSPTYKVDTTPLKGKVTAKKQ